MICVLKPNNKIETALKGLNFAGIKFHAIRYIPLYLTHPGKSFFVTIIRKIKSPRNKLNLGFRKMFRLFENHKLDLFFISFVSELI